MKLCGVEIPERQFESRSSSYVLFTIDSFLSPAVDAELVETFPDELMLERLGSRLAVNVDLSEPSRDVLAFLQQNRMWEAYLRDWMSGDQVKDLVDTFSKDWESRWYRLWRPLMRFRSRNIKNLEVTVLLSVYRAGFQLAPHSDDKFKLLSLIHYLPNSQAPDVFGAGTTFYRPKLETKRRDLRQFSEWSRGVRRYLPLCLAPSIEAGLARRYFETDVLSEEQLERFFKFFSLEEHVDYKRNRISGFVKNDWSMHEVDLRGFPTDQLRRAVLINVRLKPTPMSRFIPGLEKICVRLRARLSD